jgi:SAM-dependent methyltransferase
VTGDRNALRRTDDAVRLWSGDYFVVRHLQQYVYRALQTLVKPGDWVCDVGCGEQPFRKQVEAAGGKYVGIDIQQNSQGSVCVIARVERLPLSSGRFDLVLCSEVLEHVSDTRMAFCQLERILAPQGHLVVTTPFAYPLHEEPADYIRLTPYQVRRYAEESGLELLHLETAGNEVEVLATVWTNMWDRLDSGRDGRVLRNLRRLRALLLYGPVNLIALGLSCAFDRVLARKYYLNIMCVLRKTVRESDPAEGISSSIDRPAF